MKVKFGSLAVSGSGKIGGCIVQKDNSGTYFKTRKSSVIKRKSAAWNNKAAFLFAVQSWKNITPFQRSAWCSFALEFQYINSVGSVYYKSGFNHFVYYNSYYYYFQNTILSDPPENSTLRYVSITEVDVLFSFNRMDFSVLGPLGRNSKNFVSATRPFSPGVSSAKNNYRIILVDNGSFPSPTNIASYYINFFGYFPPVGSKVFFKFFAFDKNSAQFSDPSFYEAISI